MVRRRALAIVGAFAAACSPPAPKAPPTITFQGVSFGGVAERVATERFTAETGIRVEHVAAAEPLTERLEQTRHRLASADGPDVYLVDVTWPSVLAPHLMDLGPALGADAALHLPALVANDTVGRRLVALPAYVDVGLLFYRTDLLEKYGYHTPPATWDELETVAARIQEGERAAGRADFWGWVWEGARDEGLTCNALEWQASHGGGRLLKHDGTVDVDNAAAARAFTRAAKWVGTISPPDVLGFREEDARAVWQAGNAAFMRNWPYAYRPGQQAGSAIEGRFAIAPLPGDAGGAAHVVGGWQVAASLRTPHPREAQQFVRFMSGPVAQLIRLETAGQVPSIGSLFDRPGAAKARPEHVQVRAVLEKSALARPSTVAGPAYAQVSAAYAAAVHSILEGQAEARPTLAALDRELRRILASR